MLQSAVTLDRLLIWKHLWVFFFFFSRWPHWRLWNQQNPRLRWHTSLTWCWKGWILSIWTFPRIIHQQSVDQRNSLKKLHSPLNFGVSLEFVFWGSLQERWINYRKPSSSTLDGDMHLLGDFNKPPHFCAVLLIVGFLLQCSDLSSQTPPRLFWTSCLKRPRPRPPLLSDGWVVGVF